MKAGQKGRTLAEAEGRYRGDGLANSRTDPRKAQAAMDAEARAMRRPILSLRFA